MSKDRIEEIKKEVGQLWFDNGQNDWIIKDATRQIACNDNKICNLNAELKKLQKSMEVKLAPPLTEEAHVPTQ